MAAGAPTGQRPRGRCKRDRRACQWAWTALAPCVASPPRWQERAATVRVCRAWAPPPCELTRPAVPADVCLNADPRWRCPLPRTRSGGRADAGWHAAKPSKGDTHPGWRSEDGPWPGWTVHTTASARAGSSYSCSRSNARELLSGPFCTWCPCARVGRRSSCGLSAITRFPFLFLPEASLASGSPRRLWGPHPHTSSPAP